MYPLFVFVDRGTQISAGILESFKVKKQVEEFDKGNWIKERREKEEIRRGNYWGNSRDEGKAKS